MKSTDIAVTHWRASIDDMRYILDKFPDGEYHPDYIVYTVKIYTDCHKESWVKLRWFLDEEALKIIIEENNYKGDEEE